MIRMAGFISEYIREQKRYTKNDLRTLFSFSGLEVDTFIQRLKSYGIIKAVRNTPQQVDLTELVDDDIAITDDTTANSDCFYVFTYVGVLTIGNRIVKCYPKYQFSDPTDPTMKQVLKVLQRYGTKEQIVNLYNGDGQSSSFNLLAVMLFLMEDYHQYGPYINTEDIVEVNGEGPILWGQTIDKGFAIVRDNRPYYVDLYTSRTVDNEQDFFYRLHRSIVTECSKQLKESGLLYLFDLVENALTDEPVEEFGDTDYVLYRIQNELNIQYATHKQTVLKTMYAYLANRKALAQNQGVSMYGTTTFHTVWEDVCAEVFGNKLEYQLRQLSLPNGVAPGFTPTDRLIDIIKKPRWIGYNEDGSTFYKDAQETLIPDLISIVRSGAQTAFVIFDAKYYCIQLEPNRPVKNQPGVGDVTKQYLYQLAYREFTQQHGITHIKNCFLMPTEGNEIVALGMASMEILDQLDLEKIQIRLLPATRMYSLYLSKQTMDIAELDL